MGIGEGQEKIKRLVEKYQKVVAERKESEYSEEEVKIKFIEEFLEALGWDVRSDEVKPEQKTIVGRVDFSLRINGKEKIFFEIKSFSEDLSGSRTVRGKKESFVEQAIKYAWHRKVDWAVLTNFKETRLYYTHTKEPEEGRIFTFSFDEYSDKINKLWLISKESVSAGLLDTYEKRRTRKDIDIEVLEDLFGCRRVLSEDIYKLYRGANIELVKESIQRILDRLIVIRFMEDKGIEAGDRLWREWESYSDTVTNKEAITFMKRLRENVFKEFNEIYNSKIFEPHECDKLAIGNNTLKTVLGILYKYNFDLISADVLGNIYEDYLGHVLKEKGREVEIVEKREERKEHGIYYTPTYVVDYIVRNTLGALIEEKKAELKKRMFSRENLSEDEEKQLGKALLEEIKKIKVLDPACGSGSFLIKAFDVIKEYYDKYGEGSEDSRAMYPEKKILINNLHGVDLDFQATEIASVNLMLKALRQGQRLPLILEENIKCGNSLISGTEEELKNYFGDAWKEKKPFNWEQEFKGIFGQGGFDVVIGNPPWSSKISSDINKILAKKWGLSEKNVNICALFILESLKKLKPNGFFGFLLPKVVIKNEAYYLVRKKILDNYQITQIIDFGQFPGVASDAIGLIIKNKKENFDTEILFFEENKSLKKNKINQNLFLKNPLLVFSLSLTPGIQTILDKITTNSRELGKIFKIKRGIELGQESLIIKCIKCENYNEAETKYYGPAEKICKKCGNKLNINEENVIQISSPSKTKFYDQECISGAQLQRYSIGGLYYIPSYLKGIDYKEEAFSGPKLLIKRISTRIEGTFSENKLLAFNTVYSIFNEKSDRNQFLVTLGILNSKLIHFFYEYSYNIGMNLTTQVTIEFLSKVPIKIIPESQQQSLINLVDKTLLLNKQYHSTLDAFQKILANVSDTETSQRALREYYTAGSEYGIDLVESKKLVEMKGKVVKIEVREEGSDLIFRADYILGEKDTGAQLSEDALKIRFTDESMRKFFYYASKTFFIENEKKKNWGKGKIGDVVLNAVKIPRFSNLKVKDVEAIKRLMEEFFRASPIGKESLSTIEREIEETDKVIDRKVYELYGLTDEEIKVVEG